jgi:hypothetical protein
MILSKLMQGYSGVLEMDRPEVPAVNLVEHSFPMIAGTAGVLDYVPMKGSLTQH